MKILVANRGEIAVRVIRACREMNIRSVAVYSDCDRGARHVRDADEAIHIGPNPASESYLRIDRIIDAARRMGADAVHPGYGFLAENAAFAQACADAGLTFIGPSAEAIRLMGSKTAARQAALKAGAPVVPGSDTTPGTDAVGQPFRAADSAPVGPPFRPLETDADLMAAAANVGFPLLVKAVAGGGGKGMRAADRPGELLDAVRTARSEAGAAFGDTAVYFERRISKPRHIEIQLLGDHHGTIVPFVERECSIQRRHQKVVEESPSSVITQELRQKIAAAAAAVARTVGYHNAGTIEFLLDEDGAFYFLEMNTRLQVEHPVTEMVTAVDLVQWQIRIARGERLNLSAERALMPVGHAIECRIYAEDPDLGFMPSPGLIRGLRPASGPGIRDDGGVGVGYSVPVFYDSLIAKLIAWGDSRDAAIARMARALNEYQVLGIPTTIPFFRWLMEQPSYARGEYDTTWLDALLAERVGQSFSELGAGDADLAAIAAALDAYWRATAGADTRNGAPRMAGWKQAARFESLRA